MITVIGIFADPNLAEQAGDYLLANEFEPENIDVHISNANSGETDQVGDFFGHLYPDGNQATHYATLARNGTVVTVHAASTREAQEAVDAFNNHGAVNVDLDESNGNRSLVVERLVAPDRRLRSY